ncbi:MAG: hypothetical protein KGJ90_06830 [Patescibacteria group bacterium]|nr:hypothetical protein [Patescibacteria group bacterium]
MPKVKPPTFRNIQLWAWRRDNKNFPKKSTVSQAADAFKVAEQEIFDIVGRDHPYFHIIGDGEFHEMYFEHDGD